MDRVTIYCEGNDGKRIAVATASYDAGELELRMEDGTLLSCFTLEQWGYSQLYAYSSPLIRPCRDAPTR